MTTFSQSRTASLLAQMVNAIAGSLVVRARQLALLVKNRRDATMLAGLDDRMLADIGLTRGDLRDAYSEPVWSDPTAILVSRAHERRVNRRRASIDTGGLATYVPPLPEGSVMKIANSLKTLKKRDKNCRVVRRKGRVYVINKVNPRFKARQG